MWTGQTRILCGPCVIFPLPQILNLGPFESTLDSFSPQGHPFTHSSSIPCTHLSIHKCILSRQSSPVLLLPTLVRLQEVRLTPHLFLPHLVLAQLAWKRVWASGRQLRISA